jgi:hypothetical protein
MTTQETKNQLWEIAKAYPTLRGLLQKQLTPDKTVGQHWAELLSDCDSGHLVDVCEEYATLRQPIPQPSDQLVFVIRSECKDREYRDRQRWEQHQKYYDQPKGVFEWVRKTHTGRLAIGLGESVKAGRLSRADNLTRMNELMAWDKGGPTPEWM